MKKPTKKTAAKKKTAKAKKAPKPKAAAKAPRRIEAKGASTFFATKTRSARGVKRSPLHVLLTKEERSQLVQLSHKRKLSAADVVRTLIKEAS